MNLTKGRGAHSANITVSICIVCVIKVCILGAGFASRNIVSTKLTAISINFLIISPLFFNEF